MRRRPVVLLAAILLSPIVSGATCASAPPSPDDAVKLEEKQTLTSREASRCEEDGVPGDHSPLVVHWPDTQRAALESAMTRGVAVIKYTCEGVEVLPGCNLPGDYAYGGVSKKTQLVKMNSRLSAEANFSTGLPYLQGLEAAFAAGKSLDLAYILVGNKTTTRTEATVSELRGRCEGATHFIYQTHLGAWAMGTNASGEISAAMEVFGRGGGGGAAKSVEKMSSDGDPGKCDATAQSDLEPTDGCSALLRATLFALGHDVQTAPETRREGRRCIEGFVFKNGQCTQDAAIPVCSPDSEDAVCLEACEAGATPACAQFADRKNVTLTSLAFGKSEKQAALDALDHARASLIRACDAGEGSACTSMAFVHFRDLTGEAKEKNQREGLDFAKRGCVAGDSRACGMVQLAFTTESGRIVGVELDPSKYMTLLELGCAQGASLPCSYMAELRSTSVLGKENASDALAFADKACVGGDAGGCLLLGAYHSERVACENYIGALEMRAYPKDRRAEAKTRAVANCKASQLVEEVAKPSLERACRLGAVAACPREK